MSQLKVWKCAYCNHNVSYYSIAAGYFQMSLHNDNCEGKEFSHSVERQLKALINDKVRIGGW